MIDYKLFYFICSYGLNNASQRVRDLFPDMRNCDGNNNDSDSESGKLADNANLTLHTILPTDDLEFRAILTTLYDYDAIERVRGILSLDRADGIDIARKLQFIKRIAEEGPCTRGFVSFIDLLINHCNTHSRSDIADELIKIKKAKVAKLEAQRQDIEHNIERILQDLGRLSNRAGQLTYYSPQICIAKRCTSLMNDLRTGLNNQKLCDALINIFSDLAISDEQMEAFLRETCVNRLHFNRVDGLTKSLIMFHDDVFMCVIVYVEYFFRHIIFCCIFAQYENECLHDWDIFCKKVLSEENHANREQSLDFIRSVSTNMSQTYAEVLDASLAAGPEPDHNGPSTTMPLHVLLGTECDDRDVWRQ